MMREVLLEDSEISVFRTRTTMSQPTTPVDQHRRSTRRLRMLGAALLYGVMSSCTSITGVDERVFDLEVAEQQVPCVGMAPQQCLQVRERSDAPWTLFYDGIEGFTYEPGFRYLLRVAVRQVPNPPADGSSLAYRLVDVLTKTATP
jgi:hypothetical protein